MIEVGKIFLNFNKEKILVALAVYENNYCNKFYVLKDVVDNLFDDNRKYLSIPYIFENTGLLGTNKTFYNYLCSNKYNYDIYLDDLIQFDTERLKQLIENNKRLQPFS